MASPATLLVGAVFSWDVLLSIQVAFQTDNTSFSGIFYWPVPVSHELVQFLEVDKQQSP